MAIETTDTYRLYWNEKDDENYNFIHAYTRLYSATNKMRMLAGRFPESGKKFKIVHTCTEFDSNTYKHKKKKQAEMYYNLAKSEYPIDVK
ncbi:MAG: hypothetical protein K6G24_12210 [Lachnospiraceae bacterium]|nr:hypothetical protein [Lachnospiraceae bacterium]